jgi:hypothetical protein
VLKEKEIEKYGEYRTQRLVLYYYRAWRDGAMHEFDRWLPPPKHSERPAQLATSALVTSPVVPSR